MLAHLIGGGDGAVLRQRITHAALVVILAADEALERARVLLRDEVGLFASRGAGGALAHHHVGFLVRLAVRVDTQRARLAAEGRHLHLGHAAGRAQLGQAFNLALRKRVGHVAIGPAGATDEHAARLLRHANLQILAAFRAFAHVGVGRHGIGQGVFNFLGVRQQIRQLLGKQVARVHHHTVLGVAPLGDVVHFLFKLGGHLGMRDVRGELVERVAHRHAQLARLDGVVLNVLHRVQALDDAVARGLRAQPQLLHLLDELALAVARRRLGLLLRALGAVEGDGRPLVHGGQLLVLLHAVGVNGAVTAFHQHIALRHERLTSHVEGHLRALHHRSIGKRGQKTPRDQVVQLVVGWGQIVGRGLGRRVDGRMVGGLLLAARRMQLACSEQLVAVRRVSRVTGNGLHHLGQVKRGRIHRVVNAGVGNVAVHVQALGDAHGARGREPFGRGRGHKRGGVERHGRLLLAAAALHRGDARRCSAVYRGHGSLCRSFILETRRGMPGRKGKLALAGGGAAGRTRIEGALDHPVIFRHERQALALARHDERERGGLHATGAAHVAVTSELHERQIAREHRAPDQIDVLARRTGAGQVHVKLHQMGERVRDLLLRERRIASARHRRIRIDLLDARQRVGSDQLALAVEVGGDHDGIGLLRQVLQAADDVLFLGKLLDGRIGQIRQRVHLPRLQLHAVFRERLFLLERRARKTCRHLGGNGLAVLGHAAPAAALLIYQLGNEIGFQYVAAQADGHPLLAVDLEPVHRRVVHLVGFRLLRA